MVCRAAVAIPTGGAPVEKPTDAAYICEIYGDARAASLAEPAMAKAKTTQREPLAHHAPEGYAGKIHRLRASTGCKVGDRDGSR
jgi:hypothetical protein